MTNFAHPVSINAQGKVRHFQRRDDTNAVALTDRTEHNVQHRVICYSSIGSPTESYSDQR